MNLKLVKMSDTAKEICKELSKREKKRHDLNITGYTGHLRRAGFKIDDDEFIKFFKDLEAADVGRIVWGRNGGNTVFIWDYFMKNVAEQLLEPIKNINILKLEERAFKKQTRKVISTKSNIIAPPGLVLMYTTVDGQTLPIKLQDVEKIVEQFNHIKSKLG